MVDISLEESGLVLSKEAFSFTYEVEAMSKEGMGVIGRCGCVGEVDSRTEWVWVRGVMGSVCETDDGGADDADNGSADDCANNECANNDTTDYVSNTNPNNTSSHNGSNGTTKCSTSHI